MLLSKEYIVLTSYSLTGTRMYTHTFYGARSFNPIYSRHRCRLSNARIAFLSTCNRFTLFDECGSRQRRWRAWLANGKLKSTTSGRKINLINFAKSSADAGITGLVGYRGNHDGLPHTHTTTTSESSCTRGFTSQTK